jgi:hypothetical protein
VSYNHAMKFLLSAVFFIATVSAGCTHVGEPTSQEKKQLASWSAVVSEKDRLEVRREADRHTEWMERRKVQWMIGEYRARYENSRRAAAARAATRATTNKSN